MRTMSSSARARRDSRGSAGTGGRVPVIILGGNDNALSIARSLGSRGVPVYCLGTHPVVGRSRYATPIETGGSHDEPEQAWADYLLGPRSDSLRGAVLITGSDVGLEFIAGRRAELAERFTLDISDPVVQMRMLDKLSAYRAAAEAGIPTPRFWVADTLEEVEAVRDDLAYPLLVKPLLSHEYQAQFQGTKFVVAQDFAETREAVARVSGMGIAVMLVEQVPGPDTLLCSYYTYMDEDGQPLFHFTKRILRRHPSGMGLSCCEVTDRIPDVQDVALRFFQAVGLRGLANAEFKRDPRDGILKLIECNARFTAADALVRRSGIDLAQLVYNRLTGGPLPPLDTYRSGLSQWRPSRDVKAYRELKAAGQITLGAWLRTLARPQNIPYFSATDPMPAIAHVGSLLRRGLPGSKR